MNKTLYVLNRKVAVGPPADVGAPLSAWFGAGTFVQVQIFLSEMLSAEYKMDNEARKF